MQYWNLCFLQAILRKPHRVTNHSILQIFFMSLLQISSSLKFLTYTHGKILSRFLPCPSTINEHVGTSIDSLHSSLCFLNISPTSLNFSLENILLQNTKASQTHTVFFAAFFLQCSKEKLHKNEVKHLTMFWGSQLKVVCYTM